MADEGEFYVERRADTIRFPSTKEIGRLGFRRLSNVEDVMLGSWGLLAF